MANTRPMYEVRPYQEACLGALRNAFIGAVGFALFVLATGLGKTYVAMQFLDWLLRRIRGATETRPRVLVLCHQKPILRQLRRSFAEYFGDAYSLALYEPQFKQGRAPEADILFATFQTMKRRKAQFGRSHFDVLIVDEGHHSMADSYAATIRYFNVRFRFAMTATPNRLDLRDIRQLFGPEVYTKPLAVALAERLLPRVVYKYYLESSGRLPSEAIKGERPNRKLLDRKFFAACGTPARDKKIAEEIETEMRKLARPRALVFCQTIADCDRMTTYLVERGLRAAAVHSKVDDDEQENRLEALRTGELEVLVARDVLNEGKNIPELNLVAIVRSTASRTIFEQQIGRGLRPGKEELIVLDFVANCDRIQHLADVVAAVRKAVVRKPADGPTADGPEAEEDDDATVNVLDQDTTALPFEVRAGDVRFEVMYKDLLEVLGQTQWTLESGSAAFQDLAARLGKGTLGQKDIQAASRACECPSYDWMKKYLAPRTGTLAEALRTLGLQPSEWTVETGGAALRALAARLGKDTLSTADIAAGSKAGRCPSFTWVTGRLAGTLTEALGKIGLEPHEWTVETGKTALLALAKRLSQKTLSREDIDSADRQQCPSCGWVSSHLAPAGGGLAEALEAIGLEPGRWTLGSARKALLARAQTLGKPFLTKGDMDAGAAAGECPSYPSAAKFFAPGGEGVSEINRTLGLARYGWMLEEGKAAIRAVAARLGKDKLSHKDFVAASKSQSCPSYEWARKNAPELVARQ